MINIYFGVQEDNKFTIYGRTPITIDRFDILMAYELNAIKEEVSTDWKFVQFTFHKGLDNCIFYKCKHTLTLSSGKGLNDRLETYRGGILYISTHHTRRYNCG